MQPERKILDQGEFPGGLLWEASGISPACGCTITASWKGLQKVGFSMHPLMLLSASRRQQLAAELLLVSAARRITGNDSIGTSEPNAVAAAVAAATAIETARTGDLLEQGQQLVTAWKAARDQCRQEQDQREEGKRQTPATAAAA